MSDGFALELQKGIRAALVADSDITDLVSTRVYDEPPQRPTYPFIKFGSIQPQADDTDGSTGANISLTIDAFSRATGRVEASRIAEAIRASLHRQEETVSLAGFHLIELICETYFVDQENDERGHFATVIFSANVQTA
jgi:hypothetical protein